MLWVFSGLYCALFSPRNLLLITSCLFCRSFSCSGTVAGFMEKKSGRIQNRRKVLGRLFHYDLLRRSFSECVGSVRIYATVR